MPQAPPSRPGPIHFGVFELDPRTRELRKAGVHISLQEQCFQLLLTLLENPREVITPEGLFARFWPQDTVVDARREVNNAIARLRETLDDPPDNPRFIETVSGLGYRFIAQVDVSPAAVDEPVLPMPSPFAVASGAHADRDADIPESFDHYRIVEKIGAGGMGVVYRARDLRLGREVAIKMLPSLFASDPHRIERFQQEARATAALNHPNILAVHDLGTTGGVPYIVSELLDGVSLRECLLAGRLTPEVAIDYSIQMLHGLAAAHEKGVIHRDLTPANIFVTRRGPVKILDFGMAKLKPLDSVAPGDLATVSSSAIMSGAILGTIGYMSPEQIRGEPADQRADIFAFGTILYEMLTGKRAFTAGTAIDTLSAILNEEPEELQSNRSSLSPPLCSILRRCLAKSPSNRFQSAQDVIFSLEQIRKPSGAWSKERFHSPALRWSAAVLLFVALAVGGVFTVKHLHRGTAQIGSSPANIGQPKAHEAYQQGRDYLLRYDKSGNVDKAIACFESATKSDPQFALAFAALGHAYWTKFRLDKDPRWLELGVANAKSGLTLNEHLPAVHVTLGRVYAAGGQQELALSEFERALKLDNRNADAHLGLAGVYEKQDRIIDAEAAFKRATALRVDNWIGYNELGNFYRHQYRYAEAAEQYRYALQLVPDNAGLHANLGATLHNLGQEREAEAELRNSLALEPTYYAFVNLGVLCYVQRRFAESAEMTENALKLNNKDYRLWLNLGAVYEWLGEHDKAREAYGKEMVLLERTVKTDDRDPILQVELALLYAKRQLRDKSLARLQAALALAPGDKHVLADAGETYEDLGDRATAIEYIRHAVSKGWKLDTLALNPDLRGFLADENVRRALKITQPKPKPKNSTAK